MRKVKFINEGYYHIYNRGVDKRTIFQNIDDLMRFYQSIQEFNVIEPIGSIYENFLFKARIEKEKKFGHSVSKLFSEKEKLVDFICYNLLPNHYHFILKQVVDKGIEKFMHKVGMGYAKYFNTKNKRSGSLFQGKFKAIHIDSNEYLLHLSAYINLNHRVHNLEKFGHRVSKLLKSSWEEYINNGKGICDKKIILDQFESILDYKKFAEESLNGIKERKEIEKFILE
ncbi:transposase [Patescibacteria group bacterium]|nr:transposase [Patescibacteria group bacterium]